MILRFLNLIHLLGRDLNLGTDMEFIVKEFKSLSFYQLLLKIIKVFIRVEQLICLIIQK